MKKDALDDLILKEVERASRRDGITTYALVRAVTQATHKRQLILATDIFQRIDWLEQHGFIYRKPLHPRSEFCFTWRIS